VTAQYAPAGTQPAGAPAAQYPPTLKEPTVTDPRVPALSALVDELMRRAAEAAPVVAPTAPPATDLRDRITAALTDVWHQRAADQVPAAPEEHCTALTDAVLAVLPAPTSQAAADEPADRRARYAAAIREESSRVDDIAIAYAVMAVADAEQAVLAATLREVLDTFGPMHDVYGGPVSYYDGSADITPALYEGWRAVLDGAPRRLADEAQPTQTDNDDPICGDQYDDETCELEPEHAGAHCAGIACWDYGRAPATAATEEPQP